MFRNSNYLDTIFTSINKGAQKKIILLSNEQDYFKGRTIKVTNKELINFGSGSYLGLETDQRLKDAVIETVQKHGTQFPSSRAYLSSSLYGKLEDELNKIFNSKVIVTASTTLAHLDIMQVVISDNDAIIVDQFAHASIQSAIKMISPAYKSLEAFRHNNLEDLEDKVQSVIKKYAPEKIWVMVDGIYSMHGDYAPIAAIEELMKKYEQVYLYVDDAHGMSWTGKNGRGYALEHVTLSDRVIFTTSLNKSYACAGGVVATGNDMMRKLIRVCGPNLIFSGPIQPPMLGAGIACARIHLYGDLHLKQALLKDSISYMNQLLDEHHLPVICQSDSPIFFVGVGKPEVGYNIVERLKNEGFYVNLGIYPAVPMQNTGLRFTTTLHQTHEDIKNLVEAMAYHLPLALKEENSSMEHIHKMFKLKKKDIASLS